MKLSTILSAFLVTTPALSVLGSLALSPMIAQAADASAVLKKIDKDASVFSDTSYTATMDIYKNGTKKTTLEFNMVMKGLTKQLIEFVAPGDVAGMKILMVGDELHMYSPEFKKVRKIAAHTESQGFFNSEFRAEDMIMAKLSDRFDAEISGQAGNETTLTLTPKAEVESQFSKLEVTIDKTKGGVTKIKYFDGSGNATREQTRGGWVKIEGATMPTEISMKNLKTGAETKIKLSNVQVNQGVEDDLFSRRTLLR
jgi:outer membrane lipoprotein-sorting protein